MKMCKRHELNFDDWLEKYESNQEDNLYEKSLKKLNEKIEENKLLKVEQKKGFLRKPGISKSNYKFLRF
jgi:hypothetical protein